MKSPIEYNLNVRVIEPTEGHILRKLPEYERLSKLAKDKFSGEHHINAKGDFLNGKLQNMKIALNAVLAMDNDNIGRLLDLEKVLKGEIKIDPNNPVKIEMYYGNYLYHGLLDCIVPVPIITDGQPTGEFSGSFCVKYGYIDESLSKKKE